MSKKLKLFKPSIFAAVLILIAGSILLSWGCSKKEQKLNLYAAAGLKKPMDDVISAFQKETGIEVIPNYGPSGGLYTQIKEGQPCDLFFSADWMYIDKLDAEGKVSSATKFLKDNLVLIVSKTGKQKIKNIEDLTRPGVTVGICDPKAPVGAYAENALKKMNIWEKLSATGNLKARPSTVNQLAIMVQKDQLDAGLIFSSVAKGFDLESVQTIPTEYSGEIIFGAAIIKGGNEKLAQRFLDVARRNIDTFTQYGWEAYSR